jgi:signal transduction histidine kinase
VATAQAPIDSLEASLQRTMSPAERVDVLLQLSEHYQYLDYNKAKAFADEAKAVAKDETTLLYRAHKQMAFLASLSGDFTTALALDNQALNLAVALNDSLFISEALNFLGNDYIELGEFDEAYYYFTQSFQAARAVRDTMRMDIALQNVGSVFKEMGQFDIALQHFELSANLARQVNDLDAFPYLLLEEADVRVRQKNFAEALKKIAEAKKQIRARKLTIIETRALRLLAQIAFQQGDFGRAISYYDSMTVLYKKADNEYGIADAELGKSKIYLAQRKYDDAVAGLESSLAIAKQLNAKKLERECYFTLSQLAEARGDFKTSLAHFKQYKQVQDSLFSQDMMQKLFQGQLRFETANKDSEIASLSRAREAQAEAMQRQEFVRNILVVVVALSGILLFSVYRSGQRRIRINKLLMQHQEETRQRTLELEQLNQVKDKFFSIISHDLRSPINALSSILNMMDKQQITPEEFSRLNKELRVQFDHTKTLINNLLDWTLLQMDKLRLQPERLALQPLVDENFKLLDSLNLKETLLENEVPASTFVKADLNTINLILRNLILNGIKFTENGGRIRVSATEQEGQVKVAIADNGVGIAPEVQKILFDKTSGYSTRGTANEKGTGLGLILCKEFVEKNGGRIWLESEPGKGSTFYFTLNKA